MFSLSIWLILFLAHIIIAGLAIAWVARTLNSPRARFRAGILAMLLIYAINIALVFAGKSLFPKSDEQSASTILSQKLAILFADLIIALILFRRIFQLSWGRAFAPWGVHVAFLFAFGLLVFSVIEPRISKSFRMPTASMQPTLEPGDQFWVNRLAKPNRFDLVVFISNQPGSPIYIKRLIALPGERLRFQNNHLYINDQIMETPSAVHGQFASQSPQPPMAKEGETFQLGPTDYYLIGDDLNRSFDCRSTGPVDGSKLIGVADFRFLPLNRISFLR